MLQEISMGVVTMTHDGEQAQRVQIRGADGAVRDQVLHYQIYGLTVSLPPLGGAAAPETVLFTPRPNYIVALASMYRPSRVRNLAVGDVCLNTVWDDPSLGADQAPHRVHLSHEGGKTVITLGSDVLRLSIGKILIDYDGETQTVTTYGVKNTVSVEERP